MERSPISASDVEGARALIDDALDRRFFKDRFEMASDAEQRYLAAMADSGDGPVRTADVASRAGYKDSAGASVVRNALLRKDLVYSPRRGLIDFTVPLFGGYLRREYPLDGLEAEEAGLL